MKLLATVILDEILCYLLFVCVIFEVKQWISLSLYLLCWFILILWYCLVCVLELV